MGHRSVSTRSKLRNRSAFLFQSGLSLLIVLVLFGTSPNFGSESSSFVGIHSVSGGGKGYVNPTISKGKPPLKSPWIIGRGLNLVKKDPPGLPGFGSFYSPVSGKVKGIKSVATFNNNYWPIQSLTDTPSLSPSKQLFWPSFGIGSSNQSANMIVSNPATNSTAATVTVTVNQNGSAPWTWTSTTPIAVGQSATVTYPGTTSELVSLSSDLAVTAVIQVQAGPSVFEIPGNESPSSIIYWPEYSSQNIQGSPSPVILVANPSNTAAQVRISVGGHVWTNSTPLEPGASTQASFPGVTGGPLELDSNVKVVALKATQYVGPLSSVTGEASIGDNFGSTSLYWPWYDIKSTTSTKSATFAIANPATSSASAHVTIHLGSSLYTSGSIAPGTFIRASFPGEATGPVILDSDIAVIAHLQENVGDTQVDISGQTPSVLGSWPASDAQISQSGNSDWIVLANPLSSSSTVTIYLAGKVVATDSIPPDSPLSYQPPSGSSDPITFSATTPIIATQRYISGPPAPTISSVGPSAGFVSGGLNISIAGSNFVAPMEVFVGGVLATGVSVKSATSLTAITPPSFLNYEGEVDVTVLSVSGSATLTKAFNYYTPTSFFSPGTSGYDVSWPQCPSNLPPSPDKFSIIGADYGAPFSGNPCLMTEVNWAGSNFGLYAVIFWTPGDISSTPGPKDCSGVNATNACYAYDWGFNAAKAAYDYAANLGIGSTSWWLDIEGAAGSSNPLWSSDLASNAQAVQGAIDSFRSLNIPGTSSKETVGIYAAPCVWPQIVGGSDLGSGCTNYQGYSPDVLEWNADWNNSSNPSIYCSPTYAFTSGGIALVQYTDNRVPPNSSQGYDGDYSC
ncbi:MAG: hypothetical protein HKL80_11715 [Acidimicrobiales bacterium]|nr:hypothetical protein [Acidimicrobiales bacterium]